MPSQSLCCAVFEDGVEVVVEQAVGEPQGRGLAVLDADEAPGAGDHPQRRRSGSLCRASGRPAPSRS